MDRETGWNLLTEWIHSDSLRRHCLCVESAMRFYASQLGQDADQWGLCGLLHDMDYERFPDQHPLESIRLLEQMGEPEWLTHAIASHCTHRTGVSPSNLMERHLFACDELSGFITAVTYVRPSKSILEVETRSVLKKLKTPAFAAAVNRDEIAQGAEGIGLDLETHIENLITAFSANPEPLGLAGV